MLRQRGFVAPQPHKRPRSSWVRFEASLPNQCWQSDVTRWHLAEGTEVESATSWTITPDWPWPRR
jgi:transposase InsO family protein